MTKTIVLGITGSSGVIYGARILEELTASGVDVHLIISAVAKELIDHEATTTVAELENVATAVYNNDDLFAAPCSGSFRHDGMIIAPCSMKTLAAVAHGYSENVIARAAQVCLKERRPLLLMPRETPLSLIDLKNLVAVREAGATVMPAMPAFYQHPQTIDDMVDFMVGRVLDAFDIDHALFTRWS